MNKEGIYNIYALVQNIMQDVPETKYNNQLLVLSVWEKQGLILTERQKRIRNSLANVETITRAGRIIKKEKRKERSRLVR